MCYLSSGPLAILRMWWHLDSVLVIMCCTLAGGFERPSIPEFLRYMGLEDSAGPGASSFCNLNASSTCDKTRSRWRECPALDTTIHPLHLLAPWLMTVAIVVVLSMPTVLLRSKDKERGLRILAGNLFQLLGLLLCSILVWDHPSVCYAFTIHSCVRFLGLMEVSAGLVGGVFWWGMRYAGIILILLLQLLVGPAVSVVQWQAQTPSSALACAYLCHLLGCVAPALALSFMRFVVTSARYIHIHED
jgi:hypothetical protein